ncbi:hypothetical protein [Acinetobacter bereziniae]|uniref:hypothetical protein n=1 Tax=Acinetobacter bereziniae TaxID=106648 RepID=UPI0005733A83|nr:hypothetical protein [Acinetobacter bereziniae]CEI51521.1 hypothetical protein [Acinetobacter bereziniae]
MKSKIYKFNVDQLFACLPHIDQEHESELCRNAYIGDGYICATDKITFIKLEDQKLKGCDFLIPVEQIQELAHFRFGQNYNFVEITLKVIDDHKAVFELEGFKDKFKVFDLPKLKTAGFTSIKIEKPDFPNFSTPLVNPELLMRFQNSLKYLTGVSGLGVSILPADTTHEPIYVHIFKNVYGLVMPMSQDAFVEIINLAAESKALDSLEWESKYGSGEEIEA